MNANSLFLKHLEGFQLCCENFYFKIQLSEVPYNKNQAMMNPKAIKSSLFFERSITNYFQLYETKAVSVPYLKLIMDHASSQLSEGLVDLSEPSFFRIGQSLYSDLITYVKKIICKNSNICFQQQHIYDGFDRNKIILFKFFNEKNQREKELPIKIHEIFFVDDDGFIQFNFESFDSDSQSITFGIMLVQKMDFWVKYNRSGPSFELFFPIKIPFGKFRLSSLLLGFLVTVVLTYLILKNLSPYKDKNIANAHLSLYDN